MKFKQKRSHYKTSFCFGPEELTYTFQNSRAKVGSTVPYHKLPGRINYREIKIWWLRYVVLGYLTFCAITYLYYSSDMETMVDVLYCATMAFLIVSLYALVSRSCGMTSLLLNPALVILQDGQQKAILEEIMKRRLQMMKIKLAQIDPSKPSYEEASKLSWLREEGVINEQEYRDIRQKIAPSS